MKRIVGAVLLWAVSSAGFAVAMTQDADLVVDANLLSSRVEVDRKNLVAKAMKFEPHEAEEFWPIYIEYRDAMEPIEKSVLKLIAGYAEAYPDVTDEQATAILDEWLSLSASEARIKTKYIKKFRRVLTPKRAVRFIQVDNKLDAVIDFDAARSVPLME